MQNQNLFTIDTEFFNKYLPKITDDQLGKVLRSIVYYKSTKKIPDNLDCLTSVMFNICLDHHNTNYNIKTYVYLMQFSNNEESFIKIGLSRHVKKRFYNLKNNGYAVSIVKKAPFNTFDEARKVELDILNKFKDFKYTPKINFFGSTECLNTSVLKQIKL